MQILQKSVYLFKIVAIITIYIYKTNIYERVSRYKFKKRIKGRILMSKKNLCQRIYEIYYK